MKAAPVEGTRLKILESAISLFLARGFNNVKTRDLTDHMGISRSHIYHYFADWHTLRHEAIALFMRRDIENFSNEAIGKSPIEALQFYIEQHLPDKIDDEWQLYNSVWIAAAHEETYSSLATHIMNEWAELIESFIRAGVIQGMFQDIDTARVARLIGGAVNGYADILTVSPTQELRIQAREDLNFLIHNLLNIE